MARWSLPEEVITEILSWLPVKSLMRFKCVSKPWLHLISTDSNFMKLHFNRSFHTNNSNPNPGILVSRTEGVPKSEFYYWEDCTTTSRFVIPFSNPRVSFSDCYCCDFRVVNVCNGLVCLTEYYQSDQPKAYLWNPLTGDHITLPSPPIPSHFCDEDGSFSLETSTMFGFGFNQQSDEYKVIYFVSDDCRSHVSVYTLGADSSWRTLQQFVPYSITLYNPSTALVNGSLHWFGSSLDEDEESLELYSHEKLITFNMQDEIFQDIQQPHGITFAHPFAVLVGELGGLLSIFCSLQQGHVEIWVMEEYGVADSWRRLCNIGPLEVSGSFDYLEPLGLADNGEIIISKDTREWISYDPKTNSVRDLHSFEFHVVGPHTFKGSLVSPTIINGASSASHMINLE